MKEGFISGQKLLAERWTATDDGELLEIIKDGHEPKMLYTYEEPGIPKPYFFQVFHPTYKPIKIHGHRMLLPPPREADQVPLEVGEIEELFPFLHKCLFNIKQIEQLEKLKPALRNAKRPPEHQSDTAPAPAAPPVPVKNSANFFTKEGAIWHIGFEGKETRIKHLNGLQYIGYLLEKPGTPLSCRKLYQTISDKTPVNVMSEGAAIDEGLNIGSRKQAASDYKAKQNYLEQYQRLANDLENVENNPEGEIVRKEIEKEMEAIIPFLKERTFIDKDTARFQSNVQRRLDNAYATIHKAGMKEMEKYLQDHIKTDRAYGLTYTGTAAWEITIK